MLNSWVRWQQSEWDVARVVSLEDFYYFRSFLSWNLGRWHSKNLWQSFDKWTCFSYSHPLEATNEASRNHFRARWNNKNYINSNSSIACLEGIENKRQSINFGIAAWRVVLEEIILSSMLESDLEPKDVPDT